MWGAQSPGNEEVILLEQIKERVRSLGWRVLCDVSIAERREGVESSVVSRESYQPPLLATPVSRRGKSYKT